MPILSTTGAASARAYGAGGVNLFKFTISSNQTNADLRTLALAAGWDGKAQPVATIGSGVYVSSSSTGSPALTITGSFPNGVQLINSGYIVGIGGAGGSGSGQQTTGYPGNAGGLALSVSTAVYINNLGTIGGGGGGGGGGGAATENTYGWGGGGGGGGQSGANNSSGGAAGDTYFQRSRAAAAGSSGTSSGAGTGDIGGAAPNPQASGGVGGTGGAWGSAGSTGASGSWIGGTTAGGAGGAAGAAITGNSNIIWIAFGTRLGSIS